MPAAVTPIGATEDWWTRPAFVVDGEQVPPFIMVARFIAEARRARWERIKALLSAALIPPTGGTDSPDTEDSESDEDEEAAPAGAAEGDGADERVG